MKIMKALGKLKLILTKIRRRNNKKNSSSNNNNSSSSSSRLRYSMQQGQSNLRSSIRVSSASLPPSEGGGRTSSSWRSSSDFSSPLVTSTRKLRIRFSLSPTSAKHRRRINELLSSIPTEDGLELKLNDRGVCHFYSGNMVIVLEVPNHSSCLFLYTLVHRLDWAANRMDVMRRALELNYLQQGTRGATLALDQDEITLNFSCPIEGIDCNEFAIILDNFIETASDIHQQLVEVTTCQVDACAVDEKQVEMIGAGEKKKKSKESPLELAQESSTATLPTVVGFEMSTTTIAVVEQQDGDKLEKETNNDALPENASQTNGTTTTDENEENITNVNNATTQTDLSEEEEKEQEEPKKQTRSLSFRFLKISSPASSPRIGGTRKKVIGDTESETSPKRSIFPHMRRSLIIGSKAA